jgi:pimeloyl-ACP methyl ester carboxylesterase
MPSEASTHVRDFERRGPATRRVESESAELAVHETGDPTAPTVILVHGYPDTHGVWDEVVELLSERFHVVTYDTRGTGDSTAPAGRDSYALPRLAADLEAVAGAVSPDRPVHLVGHDWGAFQCWEALTGGRPDSRDRDVRPIASFTAVAGPRIDGTAGWALRRLRPRPSALAQIAAQARRSWYVAAIQLPVLPDLFAARGMERVWPGVMRRLEGIEPRSGHPASSLARDARTGLALYRTNLRARSLTRHPVAAQVPVQLIVPTQDRYISTGLYADADRWATRIWRRDIRAGHWLQRSHPAPLARAIGELVDHAEGAPEAAALRRARWTSSGHDSARL